MEENLNTWKDTIGLISGIIVVLSMLPYAYRVLRGEIKPSITSWGLWTIIGLAILLNYKSSGAKANVWPAIFGFTNPLIVTTLAIFKQGERSKLSKLDWVCISICLVSLLIWTQVRDRSNLAQWALYTALIADTIAAIPQLVLIRQQPWNDRPFTWGLFAVGYGLALAAIQEWTFANYCLPIYMVLSAGYITWKLALFRVRNSYPLRDWI